MDEKPLVKPIHTKTSHPVIVGVGQMTHRDRISHDEPSPSELARTAVEACVEDSGCSRVLQEVDSLSVVNMFCEAENPTGSICDLPGIKPAVREYTSIGGNTPQWLVNRAADRIAEGSIKTALLVGAEALYSEDRIEGIQTKIDGLESPELCLQPEGPATVETYTVVHSRRNEADYAVIIARLEKGQRCFAQSAKDADLFQAMETEVFVGKKGVIRPGDNAQNVMWF